MRWWLTTLLTPPLRWLRYALSVLLNALRYAMGMAAVTMGVMAVIMVIVNAALFAD